MKILSLGVLLLCVSTGGSDSLSEDEKHNWVDPSDMLNFDPTTGKMKKDKLVIEPIKSSVPSDPPVEDTQDDAATSQTCEDVDKYQAELKQAQKRLKACQKQLDNLAPSEKAYLKQFIRVLVEKLPHVRSQALQQDSMAYSATLLLSQNDLDLFNNLIYMEQGNLQDSHRALVNMIQEVKLLGEYRPETWYRGAGEWVVIHLSTILQMTAVFAMATVGVLATSRIRISWFSFFGKLLLLLFLISIPWNWWHLYKLELAQRQAKAIQDIPPECNPEDQSVWTVLRSAFSVNVDKCARYHEQMMVDPIWEVAPTRAIAVTLTKFFVEPLEHIGRSLGKFIRAPLEDLPVQMWPIVLIFLVVVFTLAMIMGFGYQIRLFYLFGIEPGAHRKKIEGVEELQQGIKAIQEKVEQLSLESHRPVDTEALVERKLQALTCGPQGGRGEYLPIRYLENVGYSRPPDNYVDNRMGPQGEGFTAMPVAPYPPTQPPLATPYPPPTLHAPVTHPIAPVHPHEMALKTPYPAEPPVYPAKPSTDANTTGNMASSGAKHGDRTDGKTQEGLGVNEPPTDANTAGRMASSEAKPGDMMDGKRSVESGVKNENASSVPSGIVDIDTSTARSRADETTGGSKTAATGVKLDKSSGSSGENNSGVETLTPSVTPSPDKPEPVASESDSGNISGESGYLEGPGSELTEDKETSGKTSVNGGKSELSTKRSSAQATENSRESGQVGKSKVKDKEPEKVKDKDVDKAKDNEPEKVKDKDVDKVKDEEREGARSEETTPGQQEINGEVSNDSDSKGTLEVQRISSCVENMEITSRLEDMKSLELNGVESSAGGDGFDNQCEKVKATQEKSIKSSRPEVEDLGPE